MREPDQHSSQDREGRGSSEVEYRPISIEVALPKGRSEVIIAGPVPISDRLQLSLAADFSPRLSIFLPALTVEHCSKVIQRSTDPLSALRSLRSELGFDSEQFLRTRVYRAITTLRAELGEVRDPQGRLPYLAACVREYTEYLAHKTDTLPATQVTLVMQSLSDGPTYGVPPAAENRFVRHFKTEFQKRKDKLLKNALGRKCSESEEARLAQAEKAIQQSEKIFELRSFGMQAQSIARRMRINRSTVSPILRGQLPPAIACLARPGGRKATEVLTVPRGESKEWAFVAGAYQGMTVSPDMRGRIVFTHEDRRFLEQLSSCIKVIAPRSNPKIYDQPAARGGREPKLECAVSSAALVRELSHVTVGCTQVPWVLLGSQQERLEYLRGLCSVGATVAGDVVALNKRGRRALAVDVAAVVDACGMPPRISFSGNTAVVFSDQASLQWLVNHDLLLPKELDKVLGKLAVSPKSKANWELDVYEGIVKRFAPNANVAYAALAADTGVPANTLRSWIQRTARPTSVDRREDVAHFARVFKLPFPDVAAYLYRTHKFSVEDSMECAKLGNLAAVKRLVVELQSLTHTLVDLRSFLLKNLPLAMAQKKS
ncbi:MAG: hypothetical protein J0M12_03925 [Deltaproteobacteria bacterium]|nr:hypothetical protein [Deltaproteobacteria bacterium]